MADDARDRQSDLAVMEMEEYVQKRLVQRLINRREDVTEIANEARRLFATGQIDERGRDTIVLYAVQDYISAGWTLLLEHAKSQPADQNSEYLFNRELGEFTLLGESVEFSGLYDLIATDEVFVREQAETVEYPQGPPRQIMRSESKAVPRDISWAACRLMDEFLASEHGMELKVDQLDDSLSTFGFSTAELNERAAEEETMDQIKEAIKSDVDARVLTEGELADDDEQEATKP